MPKKYLGGRVEGRKMMHAAIYGRLGSDAKAIATKSGKPMASANVAVAVGNRDSEQTLWVSVVGFGRVAEDLATHGKGDSISASGRVELRKYVTNDGQERESLQIVADSILSVRTVRPGKRKNSPSYARKQDSGPKYDPRKVDVQDPGAVPFDDQLPF